jgi:hypothetical protein
MQCPPILTCLQKCKEILGLKKWSSQGVQKLLVEEGSKGGGDSGLGGGGRRVLDIKITSHESRPPLSPPSHSACNETVQNFCNVINLTGCLDREQKKKALSNQLQGGSKVSRKKEESRSGSVEYPHPVLGRFMGSGNREGNGLSYRAARLHRLAESIPELLKT